MGQTRIDIKQRDLPTNESQISDARKKTAKGKKPITARPDSPLKNKNVSIKKSGRQPKAEREQSRERIANHRPNVPLWKKLAIKLAEGVVGLQKSVWTHAVNISMAITGIHEIRTGSLERARNEARLLRDTLGRPMENHLLSQTIPTKNFGNVKIDQVMEQYRRDIGEPVTREQMMGYINMGERIVKGISEGQMENGVLKLEVDGREVTVKPNLDTTRAISWYLNAKAVMDNASPGRDPVVIKGGSMVLKDEGNQLYDFLNSAPNTYNRPSSHFNERSDSPIARKGTWGILAGLARGQKSQRGIEDFSNKMPSGGGCILFDKMVGSDGSNQIFLKWESSGTPTVYGTSTHGDMEDGMATQVHNRYKAFDRNLNHMRNFLGVGHGPKDESWGMHREEISKPGAGKSMVYDPFLQIIATLKTDSMPPGEKELARMEKDAKTFGLEKIDEDLKQLETRYKKAIQIDRDHGNEHPLEKPLQALRYNIEQYKSMMGSNLGISRKGSEVHVTTNMDYLSGGKKLFLGNLDSERINRVSPRESNPYNGFINRIESNFNRHSNDGQGDCLFKAFSQGLKKISSESTVDHVQARRDAVAQLRVMIDEDRNFFVGLGENYIDEMAEQGEWGGEPEMAALARSYGVNLRIHYPDGRGGVSVQEFNHGENTIDIAWVNHNHYEFIEPVPPRRAPNDGLLLYIEDKIDNPEFKKALAEGVRSGEYQYTWDVELAHQKLIRGES